MLVTLTLILLLGAIIWLYNRLVQDRNFVRAGWSDIDVQLKRRHDLVPQLVNTVKAYADYEKALLTAVTELRSSSESVQRPSDKAVVETRLEVAMQQLLVVAEAYPELKADNNFRQLQSELVDVEEHLQHARRFYNGAVRRYNTRVQSFPHLLLARPLGFKSADYFAVEEAEERLAPGVRLS